MHIDGHTNSEALTAAGGTPPSGPRIALGVSRDLRIQLPASSSRPANSQGFGSEPFIVSPEFRERVAMAACFAFFGSIAVILVAAFFVSMLIDWYGVAETGFRLFDFG
jgi:hypothetical protein